MNCHSGQCSRETDCIEKVSIKCQCKTVKKSFVCKDLKREKENLTEKTVKGIVTTFLKCNDKCEAKKQKNTPDVVTKETKITYNSSSNLRYFILAFLVLLTSIMGFYLFFK